LRQVSGSPEDDDDTWIGLLAILPDRMRLEFDLRVNFSCHEILLTTDDLLSPREVYSILKDAYMLFVSLEIKTFHTSYYEMNMF